MKMTGIRHIRNEKGVSLVLLALAIVVLFGFAALAVDVGHLFSVKNQLQTAADAAALAAVTKLEGNGIAQPAARAEAMSVAYENLADVAYEDIGGVVNSGEPIPVTLQANASNLSAEDGGDIIVGNWDGETFTPATGAFGEIVNAVEVVARRTGVIAAQPQAQNFFAKIFRIPQHLGFTFAQDYSLANVAATAIATKGRLELLPIAVNEYWDEGPADDGVYPTGQPYGQRYPDSFMRSTNVNGTTGFAPRIFPIIGTSANSNNTAGDLNSFVDLFYRNPYHVPRKSQWVHAKQDVGSGVCSPACRSTNFTDETDGVTVGDVNRDKYGADFSFLFTGIPDNLIPPNAVREYYRNPEAYYDNNYNSAPNGNDPSECTFATVAYFQSSGAGTLNKKYATDDPDDKGIRFYEKYPKGSQFLVMVYDGTHEGTVDLDVSPDTVNGQARGVTIVGYGIIEIDGYMNGPVPTENAFSALKDGGVKQGAGTAYGHAVPHGLTSGDISPSVADVSDPYIIQPPTSDPNGSCEFSEFIKTSRDLFGTPRLVDPSLHYGVHSE